MGLVSVAFFACNKPQSEPAAPQQPAPAETTAFDEVFEDEDMTTPTKHGSTIVAYDFAPSLSEAAGNGDLQQVRNLLPKAGQPKKNQALVSAAQRGHTQIVKELLTAGAKENQALVMAAQGGHVPTVRALLDAKFDANVPAGKPLMEAVRHEHLDVVKLLVASGADVNVLEEGSRFGATSDGPAGDGRVFYQLSPLHQALESYQSCKKRIISLRKDLKKDEWDEYGLTREETVSQENKELARGKKLAALINFLKAAGAKDIYVESANPPVQERVR